MKQFLLSFFIAAVSISVAGAQDKLTGNIAYAITPPEKGGTSWKEVKLINLVTGEVIRTVYQKNKEVQLLNARTKKPITKKDNRLNDQPFATNSAACAYDKKHERLYYTPMGINQLRYIDLKSGDIYYFEDEPLGVLSSPGDIQNMITRMVIGADGNGYALTNNGIHLIRFTTNKKAIIKDLGAIQDAENNGSNSIHSGSGYGGDMVADESGNLIVITANRKVFRVNIEKMTAEFSGSVKGLPEGYTINGAAAEKGTYIIISSATTTKGYYRLDLKTMEAEKISTSPTVFNTADLANATLVSEKSLFNQPANTASNNIQITTSKPETIESRAENKISVFPNPVTSGIVKILFTGYETGEYVLQLTGIDGKKINAQSVTINSKTQIMEYRLPANSIKGAYLLNVVNGRNVVLNTERIIVE